MMNREKYFAELRFSYTNKIRFTAVDLDCLMKRFDLEVNKERTRRIEAQEYTYIEPNLIVEVCDSWAQFDQYEHAA